MNRTLPQTFSYSNVEISRSTLESLAVFSILVCSAALRFWNITIGLPNLYVHDEIFEVHRALELLRGEYNFFRIKGMYFYFLSLLSGAYGGLLVLQGYFSDLKSFIAFSLVHPGDIVLLGRIFSATLGTFSIYLVYRLAKQIFSTDSPGPLLLAFAWATCGLATWVSKWGLIETMVMVFGLLAFFPILNILEKPKQKTYLLAGFLIAAATATKVYAVLLFLPLLYAHVIVHKDDSHLNTFRALFDSKIILCGLVFSGSLIILNPALLVQLIETGEVIQQLSFDKEEIYPLPIYFKYLRWHLGNAACVLFLIGTIVAFAKSNRKICVCALFALLFFFVLGLRKEAVFIFDRYLLLSLPMFFIVTVYGFEMVLRWVESFATNPHIRSWMGRTAILVALFGFAWNGGTMLFANPVMGQPFVPVHHQALVWFESHVPDGSTVVLRTEARAWPGNQSLPLFNSKANYLRLYEESMEEGKTTAESGFLLDLAIANDVPRYNLVGETRYVIWKHPKEYIEKQGARYFIVDVEYFTGNAGVGRSLQATLSRQQFYRQLKEMNDVILLKTFEGLGVTGVSRKIEVYKVRESL